jgi:hypothetical protein
MELWAYRGIPEVAVKGSREKSFTLDYGVMYFRFYLY